MFIRIISICLFISCVSFTSSLQSAVVVVNADFQGGFTGGVANGWSSFGTAKFEGTYDLQLNYSQGLSDIPPSGTCGIYQQVNVSPGTRVRATVQALSGNTFYLASIGIEPSGSTNPAAAFWSGEYNQPGVTTLQVEADAAGSMVTIFLRARNTNSQYVFFEWVKFDDVTAAETGTPFTPTPSPTQGPTGVPTATPSGMPTPSGYRSTDVIGNLADLRSLMYARPGVETFMFSSRDTTGGNADAGHFLYQLNEGGQTWDVMADVNGPGAIVRIWMTGFDAGSQIRIYVDNNNQPAVQCTLGSFFGSCGPFDPPMSGYSSGGYYNYFPILFTQFCRVQILHTTQFGPYYQVTCQRFDSAQGVTAYTNPLNPVDLNRFLAAESQSNNLGMDPKPDPGNTTTSQGSVNVSPGQAVVLWQDSGLGYVDELWIDPPALDDFGMTGLRLQAFWDGENLPSIDAPLADFFGSAYGERNFSSLVAGMSPAQGFYCFLPMPYAQGARIQIYNGWSQNVNNINYRIVRAPLAQDSPDLLRLHTLFNSNAPTPAADYYWVLDVGGLGHFIGCVMGTGDGDGTGNPFGFLEGDEYVWVDGEASPSLSGTGTEDYFNCGFYYQDGPAPRPYHGCTVKDQTPQRTGTYRYQLSDLIPFTSRIRMGFEVGGTLQSGEYGNYRSLAFFYRRHVYSAHATDWTGGARMSGWPGVFLSTENSSLPEYDHYRVYRSTVAGSIGSIIADLQTEPAYTDPSPPAANLLYYTIRCITTDGFESQNAAFAVAGNTQVPNSLVNGDFESPSGFPNGPGQGWSGYPSGQGFAGETFSYRSATHSQKISDWSGATRALYQAVAVPIGADVIGGIYARHTKPYGGAVVEVGIDPFGGSDPNSPNISYQLIDNSFDWKLNTLHTVSQASQVTFFVRMRNIPGVTDDWLLDDAILLQTSDPALGAPSGLSVGAGAGCLNLSWTNPAVGTFATARVYRSTAPGVRGPLLADGIVSGSYQDCSVQTGPTYYYTVRAFHTTGRESANTNQVPGSLSAVNRGATLQTY